MPTYTYENLIMDKEKRASFFETYDRLIRDLKDHGYLEAAVTHKKIRKRIFEEVSSLD
jgi:hypothetical protein